MPNRSDLRSPDPAPTSLSPETLPLCPVGEPHCEVIDEVGLLRREIDRLAIQVHTDSLTGLYNYRHLLRVLALEMERTRRSDQPTALMMVDLDHFKKINDRWGHEAGNQALVNVAETLSNETRRLDIACRYGGEEFAVVLPATDMLTAIQVAERIRRRIATAPVVIGEQTFSLTASIGVDIYQSFMDETPEAFIARSDQCLYRAKLDGRDRVGHGHYEALPSAAVSAEERDMLVDLFATGGDNGQD